MHASGNEKANVDLDIKSRTSSTILGINFGQSFASIAVIGKVRNVSLAMGSIIV